ncbi:His Kinase A (phospho-acceptor) domain-containing protein [Fontibacillus panacisegetis]|uniref:histidine kinase n=1 Tax=Fontibacillus panacisegetis TaxID=670482 RepID=A0A1G7Q4E8_9BACL|nr:His Kinase A (phospho-acceptor) domain-containing protein [Fontibacillus panacisegetis]
MITGIKKYKTWKTFAIVGLFIIILTGSRLLWIDKFYTDDQPQIENGVLDLRDWDAAQKGHSINLDGQWEFYPHVFLIDDPIKAFNTTPQMLQVPGKWNDSLEPGHSTPYGYGSYRLQILVNPERDYTYSIRVPSVRSSSELYANGRLLAKSGQPAVDEQNYVSRNLPYSASFTAGDSDIIEIVVQGANFKDFRDSGIVRSMKFGTEQVIANEIRTSITMQQVVAIVFLMHAIYGIILYLAGPRDKNLLYFSLLIICVMFMNLLGSEEKVLHYWFSINYEMGFKLVHLAMIGISYALLLYVEQQLSLFLKKISRWYIRLCIVGVVVAIILPVQYSIIIQPFYFVLMLISVVLSLWSMLQKAIKQIKGSVLFLLAFTALASNYIWWALFLFKGISIVYYPWDLIIAIACFASVWFKSYFQEHLETKKLAAKLQQADKLKNEFLANTSHELRNPLHSILNLSQAVLEREQNALNKKSVRDLESVLSVGRRMSLMLSELLDVMSLRQNGSHLQLRSFSMQTIVTGVFDMLYLLADGKKVRLENQIPEHFPQVFADENRVIQIVYNLVHNAVKYTDQGEVSIRGFLRGGKAYIEIADTGIGMDEATLQRVFEPYEQADSKRSMIEGGFGLGLSISKQLVELHGGTLEVHSVPGEGSEFIFCLQLADSASSQEDIRTEIAATVDLVKSSMASSPLSHSLISEPKPQLLADRPRILVVDDDPMNLNVLESILTLEQYDMICVTSGQQALDVLESKEWDLVISDVMMPHMSGYELTRMIRSRFTLTELPILLLTARSQPEDIENGFLAGANDYVTKPVDALELRSRVRALTTVKQTVRERLQMEAAWLQAQIQPHFLFNTLNAVTALSETDLEKMRNLLDVLGSFLRNKFQHINMDELAPIEDELSIVRSYLYIEQVRFEDRLHVAWEIDECKELKIPLLTIQPLVENAIKHGIMKYACGGNIVIRISNHDTYAEITVEDDGSGIAEADLHRILEKGSTGRSGVGLINTDLRLKRHFGNGLQIKSTLGVGTRVSFKVHRK